MSRDRVHLLYIQRTIANILRLADRGKSAFLSDEDMQAAMLYYLQTLSESTTRLSLTLRDSQPQISWLRIRGFRNRVVHDYLGVDLELVWLIVTGELEALAAAVDEMLAALPPEDSAES